MINGSILLEFPILQSSSINNHSLKNSRETILFYAHCFLSIPDLCLKHRRVLVGANFGHKLCFVGHSNDDFCQLVQATTLSWNLQQYIGTRGSRLMFRKTSEQFFQMVRRVSLQHSNIALGPRIAITISAATFVGYEDKCGSI